MTTTVSPPPTESSTRAEAERAGFGIPSATSGRSRSLRLPMIFLVVVVLGVAGYLLARSIGGRSAGLALEASTVSRRSFPVLLREKGELKAAKSVDVKCEVEGRSTIISLIDEGTEVKEGDLLVKLASDQIDEKVRSEEIKDTNAAAAAAAAEKEHEILIDQNASDVRKGELALEMAGIELQKYLEGDWKQTQQDLELELERAQQVLERAKEDLKDSEELAAKEFITRGELLNDRFEERQAQHDVAKATLRKRIEEIYTHPQELQKRESDVQEVQNELKRVKKSAAAKESKSTASLEAKRAELALTRERLTKFREQQAKCEIRAPQDGLVVYDTGQSRWDRRQIAEGSEVYERQTIIKLPDPSVMVVTVRVHEAKTDRIAIGQKARVEVEGQPGKVFTGKVTKIAVLADSQNQWLNPDLKEYETEITLDQTDVPLKPGVTARADIIVREMENVLAVPVQSVFTKTGHHFVFRNGGNDAEPVEVELGHSSDEYVEVVSGLAQDDQVLLTVSDELRRTLPELAPPVREVKEGPPTQDKQMGIRPPGGPGHGRGAGQRQQGRRGSGGGGGKAKRAKGG
ncbi:MAG: efflux RND transporter periplasmic adaptor subunit [Planctomycetota bacterium]